MAGVHYLSLKVLHFSSQGVDFVGVRVLLLEDDIS